MLELYQSSRKSRQRRAAEMLDFVDDSSEFWPTNDSPRTTFKPPEFEDSSEGETSMGEQVEKASTSNAEATAGNAEPTKQKKVTVMEETEMDLGSPTLEATKEGGSQRDAARAPGKKGPTTAADGRGSMKRRRVSTASCLAGEARTIARSPSRRKRKCCDRESREFDGGPFQAGSATPDNFKRRISESHSSSSARSFSIVRCETTTPQFGERTPPGTLPESITPSRILERTTNFSPSSSRRDSVSVFLSLSHLEWYDIGMMQPWDYEECLNIAAHAFTSKNPLVKKLGISRKLYRKYVEAACPYEDVIEDGYSLVARERSTGVPVAFLFITSADTFKRRHIPESLINEHAELRLITELNEKIYNEAMKNSAIGLGSILKNRSLHVVMGGTSPNQEGIGLGKALRRKAIEVTRSGGFDTLLVEPRHPAARKIWLNHCDAKLRSILAFNDFRTGTLSFDGGDTLTQYPLRGLKGSISVCEIVINKRWYNRSFLWLWNYLRFCLGPCFGRLFSCCSPRKR